MCARLHAHEIKLASSMTSPFYPPTLKGQLFAGSTFGAGALLGAGRKSAIPGTVVVSIQQYILHSRRHCPGGLQDSAFLPGCLTC